MLDVRADVDEDVVPPLVALLAADDVAPVVFEELPTRAQPPREALQEALVELHARVPSAEIRRAPTQVLELDARVRV